ncbi:beta strand repeat-containing protein [Deinococcus pimensis]|uniref:beta strand repeat-containing protein n=1 Tax=Deinococcus pimensis TaxID=309888 RepID=UPI0004831D20|nr:Ig-like domain-containing protein [Deinococcus pimensis]
MKTRAPLSATLTLTMLLAACGTTPPPAAPSITPQSLTLALTATVGATTSTTFTFDNTGGSDLTYDTTVSYPDGKASGWLTLSGTANGTLPAGQSATVTLNAICQPYADAYGATLTIKNRADGSVKDIPVVLNCTAESNTGDNAPVLSIDAPTETTTLPVTITGRASDNVLVHRVTYTLNGGTETRVPNITAAKTFDLNFQVTGLKPGDNELKVTAYDSSNNAYSQTRAITYNPADTTPPEVSAGDVNVTPGGTPGTINIGVTPTNGDTVARIDYIIKDGSGATVTTGTDSDAPFTAPNGETLPPGTYTVIVTAYDASGNASQPVSTTFTVADYVKPTVTVSTTDATTLNASGSVHLTATAVDTHGAISKVEFLQDGEVIATDTTAPYEYTATFDSHTQNGTHVFTARAYDNATPTNSATSSTHVTVSVNLPVPDTTPPQLGDGSVTVTPGSGTVTIGVTPSNSDTVTRIDYTVKQGDTIVTTGTDETAPFTAPNGELLQPGSYTLIVVAYDAAGNASAPYSTTVTVADWVKPSVTGVTLDSATAPIVSSSTPSFTVSASDNATGGVTAFKYSLDGGATLLDATMTTDGNGTFKVITGALPEGTSSVILYALDAQGNTSSASTAVSVTVDTARPTAVLTVNPSVVWVGTTATVTLSVDAQDVSGSGVTSVVVARDGGQPLTATFNAATNRYEATDTFAVTSAGTLSYTATVTDAAGLTGGATASVTAQVPVNLGVVVTNDTINGNSQNATANFTATVTHDVSTVTVTVRYETNAGVTTYTDTNFTGTSLVLSMKNTFVGAAYTVTVSDGVNPDVVQTGVIKHR